MYSLQKDNYMPNKHISLNSIRVFTVAAKAQSFKLAAEQLCVTAGAISRQIQKLEEQLGIELFEKDDFVRLLTIPTTGLKRIKILDRTLRNGKIVKLKFIIL